MSDRREAAARPSGAANGETPPGPAADRERVLLLECRLEEMRASLDAARAEADQARARLADAAAREAGHARRFSVLHEELADARSEIVTLHRHLERVQALRAQVEGYLFEGGRREDAEELVRLRRTVLAEDQRALVSERTVTRLRARIEELVSSRETLLARVAEWQQLIRDDGPEAADLSEFLAELLREILDLEHRSAASDAREARLRERLTLAGIDPDRVLDPTWQDEPGQLFADDAGMREVTSGGGLAGFTGENGRPAGAEEPIEEEPVETEGEAADLLPDIPADVAADIPADVEFTEMHEIGEAADLPESAEAAEPEEAAPAPETVEGTEPEEAAAATRAIEPVEAAAAIEAIDAEGPAAADEPLEPALSAPAVEAADPGVDPPATRRRPILRARRAETADAAPLPPARPSALTGTLLAELERTDRPTVRSELLLRLARTGDPVAPAAIRPWTEAPEPSVRAAAYEALGRLLEKDPAALEPHLRNGLADTDARVRRRVALATATARGLAPRSLLAPLKRDPDPQVRRVVREILRRIPPAAPDPSEAADLEAPSLPNRALGAHK